MSKELAMSLLGKGQDGETILQILDAIAAGIGDDDDTESDSVE